MPFDRLVKLSTRLAPQGRHPLFQTSLVLQNNAEATFDIPGLTTVLEEIPGEWSHFDISVNLTERYAASGDPDGIGGALVYALDLYDEGTAAALAARLVRLLGVVAADPAIHIGQIDIPSRPGRQPRTARCPAEHLRRRCDE